MIENSSGKDQQEQQQLLKTLVERLTPKPSHYIQVNGKKSTIQTVFSPPITFPSGCTYELACTGVETYFSFPNIGEHNNTIRVKIKDRSWRTLQIPTGSYELSSINTTLKRLIEVKDDKSFCLSANNSTLKSILTLGDKTEVDFNVDNSLCTVLGFEKKKYSGPKRFESENIVSILRVNSILVNCDIVKYSTRDGISAPVIYDFFPLVGPGQKIVSRPRNLIYLPLTLNVISRMTVWLTDQNGEELDLRGENVSVTFHVRAC